MFVITTVFSFDLDLYLVALLICLKRMRRRETLRYQLVVDNTPNGLLDWVRQAVIITGEVEPGITHSNFKNWGLSPSYNYQNLQLTRKGEEHEYRPVAVQSMQPNSTEAQNPKTHSFDPPQLPGQLGAINGPQSLPGTTHGKWDGPGPQ